MSRIPRVIVLIGLLVAGGAAAQPGRGDDALARALLIAADAGVVRLETHDGRVLEGQLSIAGGDSVRVFGGRGPEFAQELVAATDIARVFVRDTANQEPLRIGGFLGGVAGQLVGFALGDVNTIYVSAAGTALGYGVGYTLRRRASPWMQVFPAPARPVQESFERAGWFTRGSFGLARADAGAADGIDDDAIEEWFFAAGAALGLARTPGFALTLVAEGWAEPDIVNFNTFDVFSTYAVRACVYPAGGLVLAVGGGAAVAEHNTPPDREGTTDWGWAISAVAAYEVRVGKSTFLGPAAGVDYMRFDGDYFDDVTVVTVTLRLVTY